MKIRRGGRRGFGPCCSPSFAFAPEPALSAEALAKVVRIGFLVAGGPANAVREPALKKGLQERGYVEGRNLVIETRYAEGVPERLPGLADELVRSKVDLINLKTARSLGITVPPAVVSRADRVIE